MSTPNQDIDQLTIESYVVAFRAIEPDLTTSQRALLLAHYRAPGRLVTATDLARTMRWQSFGPVNLQYGRLARKLNEVLKIRLGDWAQVNILVTFGETGAQIKWILRPQVMAAMEALGWCGPETLKEPDGNALVEIEVAGTHIGSTGRSVFPSLCRLVW